MDTNLIITPILSSIYGLSALCLSDRVSQIDPIVYSKRVNTSRHKLPSIVGDAFLISWT